MTELRIIVHQNAEEAASPEFAYLLSMVELAASRVWPSVLVAVDPPAMPDGDGPVLILGTSRTYVAERSLARMRDCIENGRDVIFPFALSATALAQQRRLYTLRQFEELEAEFFAGDTAHTQKPTSHLPVCLLSASTASMIADQIPIGQLLADESALKGRLHAEVDGLAHTFIDYYGEQRDDVERFVVEDVRDVLEIGCGGGATGQMLTERRGVRVTGVELNPAAAERASRSLERVIIGDVAQVELPVSAFDLVLALELVEHLPDCESVLRKLARTVRPGGKMVLSIPNVGHYSVVRDLLAGRWDYLPVGLLCYTHFRFFCRTTLEDWLGRCGFDDFEIQPQNTELPEEIKCLADHITIDLENLSCLGFYVIVNL
ncbi:MAG: class I SAM-dependent methyltransferase [bacterium]|nr:class I SAM-dependent methyltransferase [bacterium]